MDSEINKGAGKRRLASNEIDMTKGPILEKMLSFAFPLMASSVLQLLFNAADVLVVGNFAGDEALAAVGSNGSLINLLVNLFVGLSIGVNVLAARYYGSGDGKSLSETVHTAMLMAVISGIILTIIGVIFARTFLVLMQSPEDVLPLAAVYLRIYFLSMTPMMIYNFGAGLLRAKGDTKRPLYFLTAAGIINVVLNLIFVIGFDMDVAGVAIATVVSECVSALLVWRCLMNENGDFRLDPHKLKIYKNHFRMIIRIGLPAGLQGVLFSISNVIIQTAVNSFGSVVVAGSSAAINVENFVYVAMNAFSQAEVSFVSQNVGAMRYDRIGKITRTALACSVITGAFLGITAYVLGDPLIGIFTDSEDVIEQGIIRLRYLSAPYAICGAMEIMSGAMRGMGYSLTPTIVTVFGACVFRIVWLATVFMIPEYHTISTVYISYPISWILTLAIHCVCFFRIYNHKIRPEIDKARTA
ncbi:MAG: MATE family efflux transporter [Eubacterium sp.]